MLASAEASNAFTIAHPFGLDTSLAKQLRVRFSVQTPPRASFLPESYPQETSMRPEVSRKARSSI